jgi:hypothetical protein
VVLAMLGNFDENNCDKFTTTFFKVGSFLMLSER